MTTVGGLYDEREVLCTILAVHIHYILRCQGHALCVCIIVFSTGSLQQIEIKIFKVGIFSL